MGPKKATASPHRFVAKKRDARTGTPSSLRMETNQDGDNQPGAAVPAQFAQAPRFSHGRPRSDEEPQQPLSPAKSGFLQALKGSRQATESVDDAPSDDEEMLDHGLEMSLATNDHHTQTDQWTNDLPMSPKRRKLGDPSAIPFTMRAGRCSAPFYPESLPSSNMPAETTVSRPAFVRRTEREGEAKEPIPEIFSPHRRGAKFVPGGMASTAQQWILEAGQAAVQSRKGTAYLQGDVFVMRVKIEGDVEGEGPRTVVAMSSSGERVSLLLTGSANRTTATRHTDLSLGTVIGIRAPTWDVELEGETWTVAVDWRIVS